MNVYPRPKQPESSWSRQFDALLRVFGWGGSDPRTSLIWHDNATNQRARSRCHAAPLVCGTCGKPSAQIRNAAGFLDRVAVRPSDGRLLICELKSERGMPTPPQRVWLDALADVRHLTTGLFRPSDLERLERLLR